MIADDPTLNVSNVPPKARIELTVQKSQYNLGEQIKGGVRILSEEEFDVTHAIVLLTCNEDLKKTRIGGIQDGILLPFGQLEYWDSSVTYGTSSVLFGAARIPKGFDATYSYSLNTSIAAKETLYSTDHYVRWFLYAALEVRCRPRISTITYEIVVAKPQISQSSPIVMKEVTREVVLIPCAYCSGLMPQTFTFCPNCGAKRKA